MHALQISKRPDNGFGRAMIPPCRHQMKLKKKGLDLKPGLFDTTAKI
jgi:hypothetical protein